MLSSVILRDTFCSLPYDFEISNKCVLGPYIVEEGPFPLGRILPDAIETLQDLGKVNPRILLHRGLASLRILRRRIQ
jgi:hypothetical protein